MDRVPRRRDGRCARSLFCFPTGPNLNDGHEWSRFLNDHLAGVRLPDNPKRFIGMGTLPMQDIDLAIKELATTARKNSVFNAVEIGSEHQR